MQHHHQNPQERYQNAGYGTFAQSLEWLANLLAFAISFFATPEVHKRTIEFVQSFAHENYALVAEGAEGAIDLFWWVFCWLFVFCITRMTVTTTLVIGGLTLAAKLL